jgi:hypothetical protein
MKDPLDRKLDALLASRPLRADDDFAVRVLAAAEADERERNARPKRPLGKLIAFTLPIAAAIALALSLLQFGDGSQTKTRGAISNNESTTLTTAEAQEIFLLEESLAGLAAADASSFGGGELLATLDTLYLEI